MTINSMIRILSAAHEKLNTNSRGLFFFPLGGGGNLLCSHHVPMCSYELPMCFPWVLHDVLPVPNEFPKGVRNSISLVWPLLTHIGGPKGRDSISTKQLLFWKASQVSVFVFFFWVMGESNRPTANIKLFTVFPF